MIKYIINDINITNRKINKKFLKVKIELDDFIVSILSDIDFLFEIIEFALFDNEVLLEILLFIILLTGVFIKFFKSTLLSEEDEDSKELVEFGDLIFCTILSSDFLIVSPII